MQPSEALGIAAQVAVTLAGFAGIVVVFRPESVHRWSALDRFRLQLLLTNSALPLVGSLVGLFLLSFQPVPLHIWRWCSAIGFTCQFVVMLWIGNPRRHVPAGEIKQINRLLFYGLAVLGTVAMLLQVINVARWKLFWPFFGLIFIHLLAALAQFVRMVLLPPQ